MGSVWFRACWLSLGVGAFLRLVVIQACDKRKSDVCAGLDGHVGPLVGLNVLVRPFGKKFFVAHDG